MNNALTPSETGLISVGLVGTVTVLDLKTESEWGEPGPPAVPNVPSKLGPCTRRHRGGSGEHRDGPHQATMLRASSTVFGVTEIRSVPWPAGGDPGMPGMKTPKLASRAQADADGCACGAVRTRGIMIAPNRPTPRLTDCDVPATPGVF